MLASAALQARYLLPDAPIMDGVAAPVGTYGVNFFFSPRPTKVFLYKHTAGSKR